jgi:hypothetical protein
MLSPDQDPSFPNIPVLDPTLWKFKQRQLNNRQILSEHTGTAA